MPELYAVVTAICDYTLAMVEHCEGRLNPGSPSVFADRRNYYQHQLSASSS